MGSKKKKTLKVVLITVVILVAIRLALPYVILHFANKSLANMDGYYGHIEDIDLSIIRGAYKIDSIYLHKVDSPSQKQTPFFASSEIDLSIEWPALWKGSIVGELIFQNPMLRFTKDKVEPGDVQKDSTSFKNLLEGFMPLKVDRVEVNNGNIQYIDEHSEPPVDIAMTQARVLALNLINSFDSTSLLPASVSANANIYDGTLALNIRLNPMASQPTFDMNVELNNTNLVKLNDFFSAYANVDVNDGTFGLYSEVAAKEGRFTGYVKPVIEGLDVLGKEDKKENLFKKMWEGMVEGTAEIFENQKRDRVATKIPLEGSLDEPDANVWIAIWEVIQNAFIQAIQPSLDQQINIGAVDTEKKEDKNLLEKVFGGKDDKKKKDKKNN